jgi:hypothetical protein
MTQDARHERSGGRIEDGMSIEAVNVVSAGSEGAVPETAPIELEVVLGMTKARQGVGIRLDLRDTDGALLFVVTEFAPDVGSLAPCDRVRVRVRLDNPLAPGEYEVGIRAGYPEGDELKLDSEIEWSLISIGGHSGPEDGVLALNSEVSFSAERGGEPRPSDSAGSPAVSGTEAGRG